MPDLVSSAASRLTGVDFMLISQREQTTMDATG